MEKIKMDLQLFSAGVVTSSNFQELLEPGLRTVFFNAWDEFPEQYSKVFNVKSSTKAKETDSRVAGTGMWTEKESMGPIAYETIEPDDGAEYVHTEFAKGIQVERKFVDDEMYDVIKKLPADLARGGRALVETTAANILNNGFSDEGYDGEPLFDDAHPITKGGTCDNKLAADLDDSSLKEAIVLMRSQRADSGLKIQIMPKKLIVPAALEFTALTLLNSAQVVGSDYNDVNVLRGKLDPVVLDYLTDDDAWFLQAASHELNFFWRVRPEFAQEKNFDTMVAKYRGYCRFSVGYSDWRGMVGSTGADPAAGG